MKLGADGFQRERTCHEACRFLTAGIGARCVPGNLLTFLDGGEVFVPAMLEAIERASETVDLELFRAHPGRLWTLLKAALLAASARGNRVRLIVDAIGSRGMNSREWRDITDAGVLFRMFRPIRLSSPILSTRRNHRKILVVDGRVAFTGGMSFDDVFYRNPEGPTWREAMVQISGPVTSHVQDGFNESWSEFSAREFDDLAIPRPEILGQACALFVRSSAPSPNVRTLFLSAITGARTRIFITNPFVMPDRAITEALITAALAGVDVRILVPGGPAFDRFGVIREAMNSYYDKFLVSGVRVFEYQPSMLHAKTMVVDSHWCVVGSSNLDARSLHYNDEADLASCDHDFAKSVEDSFLNNISLAKEITASEWQARSTTKQFREFLGSLIRRYL